MTTQDCELTAYPEIQNTLNSRFSDKTWGAWATETDIWEVYVDLKSSNHNAVSFCVARVIAFGSEFDKMHVL